MGRWISVREGQALAVEKRDEGEGGSKREGGGHIVRVAPLPRRLQGLPCSELRLPLAIVTTAV
jgi:hypothetical protein